MMIRNSLLLILMTFILFCACHQSDPKSNEVKIAYGIEDNESFPSVVGLYIKNRDKKLVCTGSIVRDDLILTAAHCLSEPGSSIFIFQNLENEGGFSGLELNGISSNLYVKHPEFMTRNRKKQNQLINDLAFIVFKHGTFANKMAIAKKSVNINAKVTLIGYGRKDGIQPGQREKRYKRFSGSNNVTSIMQNYGNSLTIDAEGLDGQRAVALVGDSGGPLVNEGGEIVGVASLSVVMISTHYVNVTGSSARKFIRAVMQDPNPSEKSGCRTVNTVVE